MATSATNDLVAVVTGAARGIGRGIALVLGEAGSTVYVTDRESRQRRFSGLPGTVEDTAEEVTGRGGRGLPVVVDHTDDDAVAAPLLIARGRGLIVLTGYTQLDAEVIGNHLYYDLAMTATSRLARSLAHDLRPHGVTALAISPGFTRTEAIVAAMGGGVPPSADSVEFAGRAVRALLADPEVARHAGRTIPVANLAQEYGFTDILEEAG